MGGTKRTFQIECFGSLVYPGTLPIGRASPGTRAQRVDLRLGQWCVDAVKPAFRTWYGPVAQRHGTTVVWMQACPGATPNPIFGSVNQSSTHGVALHVSGNGIEVAITLHGKGLKAILIDVAQSIALPILAPPSRVRGRHLMHEIGELIVQFGP